MKQRLYNVSIVLPDHVRSNGHLAIEDGVISAIGEDSTDVKDSVDLKGAYLLPGLIDLHSDFIEKDVEPRPGAAFPYEYACLQSDARSASAGITTIFQSIAFGHEQRGLRSNDKARKLVETLAAVRDQCRVDTRLHLRYEIKDSESADIIENFIQRGECDLLSVMDHTPGAQLYADVEAWGASDGHFRWLEGHDPPYLSYERKRNAMQAWERMKRLASSAQQKRIPFASHDDKSRTRIELIKTLGATISEFPFSAEIARYEQQNGIASILGAPNAVRGSSHLNWLNAHNAAKTGLITCLCSDYHPTSLLAGVFQLANTGSAALHESVTLATKNPANVMGLSDRGEIAVGKRADLIAVSEWRGWPFVTHAWVKGKLTHASCNHE